MLLVIIGIFFFSDISVYINQNYIPGFLQGKVMEIIVKIILWLFMLLAGYISYKEVVLILFAPVLGYLSERVEILIYNNTPPPFIIKNLIADIIRSLTLSMRNIIFMLPLTIAAWFVAFIPVIGTIISPVLLITIQSYYGGSGLVDYTLERNRYSVRESIEFARSNRGRITGVGMGFVVLLMIPIFGWFAAPGYGTVAATLATLEKINGDAPELRNL
jgi:CysZ protein